MLFWGVARCVCAALGPDVFSQMLNLIMKTHPTIDPRSVQRVTSAHSAPALLCFSLVVWFSFWNDRKTHFITFKQGSLVMSLALHGIKYSLLLFLPLKHLQFNSGFSQLGVVPFSLCMQIALEIRNYYDELTVRVKSLNNLLL